MLSEYGKKVLKDLRSNLFLSENGDNSYKLLEFCKFAIDNLIKNQGNDAVYKKNSKDKKKLEVTNFKIPETYFFDKLSILEHLHENMQGGVNVNSPLLLKGFNPQANFIYLSTYLATSLYMLNGVSTENSGQALNSELACAAALSDLAGYNPENSTGFFTSGDSGPIMYGMKIGLAKVDPNHVFSGISKNNLFVISSNASHYSTNVAAKWLGIGLENSIHISTNKNQSVKLDELEKECKRILVSGGAIGCLVVAGGCTHADFAIDDFEKIYEIRNNLVKEFNLKYIPHIHADISIGWAYLNFNNYDFKNNTLGFKEQTLKKLSEIVSKFSGLKFVDSFGVDFHTTGFVPYSSSMIVVKNKNDINYLNNHNRATKSSLEEKDFYDPWSFTMDTLRSCANMIAIWTTLKSFGREGFQVLLGNALEMSIYFRVKMKVLINYGIYVVNQDTLGTSILFRIYPPGVDPEVTFSKELLDTWLEKKYSHYLNSFYNWFNSEYNPKSARYALGKSNPAFYSEKGVPIEAIRVAILNPNITIKDLDYVVREISDSKKQFDELVTMIDRKNKYF